jgi:hypothetical protein
MGEGRRSNRRGPERDVMRARPVAGHDRRRGGHHAYTCAPPVMWSCKVMGLSCVAGSAGKLYQHDRSGSALFVALKRGLRQNYQK